MLLFLTLNFMPFLDGLGFWHGNLLKIFPVGLR
jgi:hypothetical protein